METETMGKVLVTAKIENLQDLYLCEEGAVARRPGPPYRSPRRLGQHRGEHASSCPRGWSPRSDWNPSARAARADSVATSSCPCTAPFG